MIKLNTPYHVAKDNVTVTFTELKNGAIIGTYPNAIITATLEGNVLSATWLTFHNTAVNSVGLIELTFNENGFEGKWKNGLEQGPMRGKWSGTIVTEGGKNEKINNTGISLYSTCQPHEENKLWELEFVLTELVVEGAFQGKESAYTLIETIQQINRTFGQLCWRADREPVSGMKTLEHYSTKWGELLELLRERAVLSSEFRTLGEYIQSDYQPFFDGDKAIEFTQKTYAKGIELCGSFEDINWFTAASINGEYFESDDLVLAAGKKAIQLVENADDYVSVCFDENCQLTYNEEVLRETVEIIRNMKDEINPELLSFLREELVNNGYDDLLEDL